MPPVLLRFARDESGLITSDRLNPAREQSLSLSGKKIGDLCLSSLHSVQ